MAKVKVRDKTTGKIIEIDEAQLGDYGLGNTSTTKQPQSTKKTFDLSDPLMGYNFVSTLLGNAAKDTMANVEGIASLPGVLGDVLTGKRSVGDTVSGVVGGVADEYKGLVVNPETGKFEPLEQFSRQLYSRPVSTVLDLLPVGQLAKSKLAGGATKAGIAAKASPSLTTKAVGKVGKAVESVGEDYLTKGFGKPTGLSTLEKKYGSFTDLLKNNPELTRGNTEGYQNLITKTQGQFDDIALDQGKNVAVNVDLLRKNVMKRAEELATSNTSDGAKAAEDLLNEFGIFEKRMGQSPTLADINKQKTIYYNYTNNFQTEAAKKGVYQNLSDAFRDTVLESARGLSSSGKDLGQLGQELKKLYGFQKYFDSAAQLGKTTNPIGLRGTINAARNNPFTGIPVSIAENAINSPTGVKAISNLLRKGGGALSSGASKIASPLDTTAGILKSPLTYNVGRAAGQLPETGVPAESGATPTTQQTVPSQMATTTPGTDNMVDRGNYLTDISTGDHYTKDMAWKFNKGTKQWEQAGGGEEDLTLENIPSLMMKDLVETGGKNISKLETIASRLEKSSGKAGTGKQTEKQRMFSSASEGAQHALDLLESGKVLTGPISGRIEGFKSATIGVSQEQQDYLSTIALARSALLNAFLGGNIPPTEYARISQGIPSENDPTPTAKTKLKTFIRELERFSTGSIAQPTISATVSE